MRTRQSPNTANNNQANSTTQTPETDVMTATTAQTDRPANTLTAEVVRTLAGPPLQAAYREVLGTEPKPKTPVPVLRSRIINKLEERVAEEATARAAGDAAHEAAVEMIEASAAPATAEEPAAPAAAEEPAAPARDNIDLAIERARSMEPAAQKIFLDGFAKKDLHAIVERLTGTKTSGRLAPATAVTRILEALATPTQPAPSSATEQPAAQKQQEAAQPEGAEQHAEGAEQHAEGANDDAPAPAEAKPAGDAKTLPPVGTEIHKRDRHGAIRATCKVVEGGIEYNGKVYTSLSAAGLAATKDLGLTTKSVNGWLFWGLADQPRPARAATPKALDFEAIEGAFKRYLERAQAATQGARAEDRAKLQEMLAAHSKALLDQNAAVNQPADATPDGDSAATPEAA